MDTVDLSKLSWEFAQVTSPPNGRHGQFPLPSSYVPTSHENWKPVRQLPSSIHSELLHLNLIPDPFKRMNEQDVQWVGERDWLYQTTISTSSEFLSRSGVDLVCDGLDTFATIFINGHKVTESDNMHVPLRIPLKRHLQGGDNLLTIYFSAAFLVGRDLESKYGKMKAWNGDPSRVYVRKMQCAYGWDWGPVLMTCGICQGIKLESYDVRIDDFNPQAIVSTTLQPSLQVIFSLKSSKAMSGLQADFRLSSQDGQVLVSRTFKKLDLKRTDTNIITFEVSEEFLKDKAIELWQVVNYRNTSRSAVYRCDLEVYTDNGKKPLANACKMVGFRRLELVQESFNKQPGTSFYFRCNNVPIFCGGANWIPIDAFPDRANKARIRQWLQRLVECNQNMIRVWGGGVYESDDFYDICDELGILVWQDFLFACGQYPAHDAFVSSVKDETVSNVRRLRTHASLAILVGNNEDYQIAEAEKLEYDPKDRSGNYRKTTFPARYIYECLLPDIVSKYSSIVYHPGSPWGGKDTRDPTVGDIHQWNVWHGSQQPYQDWDKLSGRFVSEFGMQALPDLQTIDYWLDGDEKERFVQSKTMDWHNKAAGFERRLACYMIENFRYTFDLADFQYISQLMQAECLSGAYNAWRREWQGDGERYCGGALVWQLNDVWPTTSWSIIDYFGRPKAAYYAIKRALARYTVCIKRQKIRKSQNSRNAADYTERETVAIWAANSTLNNERFDLLLECFDLLTGESVQSSKQSLLVEANGTTELCTLEVPYNKSGQTIIATARLVEPDSQIVMARYSNWPEPFKYLQFPNEEACAVSLKVNGTEIRISAQRPLKGFTVYYTPSTGADSNDGDLIISDNCIDLIPGDEQIIYGIASNKQKDFTYRYLGQH